MLTVSLFYNSLTLTPESASRLANKGQPANFEYIFQAVNLVNGMIVDGLGHVSLDSGNSAVPGGAISQANIPQGENQVKIQIHPKTQTPS